jgi:FixJ family two-component response regulator
MDDRSSRTSRAASEGLLAYRSAAEFGMVWEVADPGDHGSGLGAVEFRSSDRSPLARFAEQSSTGLWTVDAASRAFDYRNPCHLTLSDGAPTFELRNWTANVVEADRAAVTACYEAAFGGATEQHEYRMRYADGTILGLCESVFPIRDDDGSVVQIGGITERVATVPEHRIFFIGDSKGRAAALAGTVLGSAQAARSFASVAEFLHLADVLAPGCVLIDLNTVEDGSEGRMQSLYASRDTRPVVVIGGANTDAATAVAAMRAGAVDVLLPPFSTANLDRALHAANARIGLAPSEPTLPTPCTRVEGLSHRELEVLAGLRAGGTNKSIGRELGISPRTVESHRSRLMERMNARNLAELLRAVQ